MKKTEWIEEHNKEIEDYGKSMLNHDEDYDPMKEYEWSIMHHDDDDMYYNPMTDDDGGIKHFQD